MSEIDDLTGLCPDSIPRDVWAAALAVSPDLGNHMRAMRAGFAEVASRAILAERERCSRIVEQHTIMHGNGESFLVSRFDGDVAGLAYATAIRSGGR